MKKISICRISPLSVSAVLVCSVSLFSEVRPGMSIMAGARYDNLRMCAASPAGTKGGPIADAAFMLDFDGAKLNGGVKIPVFRPILFGAAFKMVQFEPELFARFEAGRNGKWSVLPGAGVSIHYGPDYLSDRKQRTESFWAAGPIFSVSVLRELKSSDREIGVRPFVTKLYGENGRQGVVMGCSAEFLARF